jgi:hypothetical protein
MLLGRLLKAVDVDDIAKKLAEQFSKKSPPPGHANGVKDTLKSRAKAAAYVCQAAQTYQRQHKWGLYGKARFSNTFKWELKERGYDDVLVNELVKNMLLAMAQKTKA